MKITIWGDYACPFCYMGETMLENLIEEIKFRNDGTDTVDAFTIDFKAYELDPDAPDVPVQTMTEHFSSEHDITQEEAVDQMAHIAKMATRVGLDYNMEDIKVCSTFDAHRLMKFAAEHASPEEVLKLNFALFKANFTENLLLSDHAVLADIAAKIGLDRKAVEEMLASDRYADEVRKDEQEAEKLDLEYIPYLLFEDGTVLQGVLSKGALKKTLAAGA